MANALNEVYEKRFLDCSCGFRPGRSAHDVVRYIIQTIMVHRVDYVLEADIKGFDLIKLKLAVSNKKRCDLIRESG